VYEVGNNLIQKAKFNWAQLASEFKKPRRVLDEAIRKVDILTRALLGMEPTITGAIDLGVCETSINREIYLVSRQIDLSNRQEVIDLNLRDPIELTFITDPLEDNHGHLFQADSAAVRIGVVAVNQPCPVSNEVILTLTPNINRRQDAARLREYPILCYERFLHLEGRPKASAAVGYLDLYLASNGTLFGTVDRVRAYLALKNLMLTERSPDKYCYVVEYYEMCSDPQSVFGRELTTGQREELAICARLARLYHARYYLEANKPAKALEALRPRAADCPHIGTAYLNLYIFLNKAAPASIIAEAERLADAIVATGEVTDAQRIFAVRAYDIALELNEKQEFHGCNVGLYRKAAALIPEEDPRLKVHMLLRGADAILSDSGLIRAHRALLQQLIEDAFRLSPTDYGLHHYITQLRALAVLSTTAEDRVRGMLTERIEQFEQQEMPLESMRTLKLFLNLYPPEGALDDLQVQAYVERYDQVTALYREHKPENLRALTRWYSEWINLLINAAQRDRSCNRYWDQARITTLRGISIIDTVVDVRHLPEEIARHNQELYGLLAEIQRASRPEAFSGAAAQHAEAFYASDSPQIAVKIFRDAASERGDIRCPQLRLGLARAYQRNGDNHNAVLTCHHVLTHRGNFDRWDDGLKQDFCNLARNIGFQTLDERKAADLEREIREIEKLTPAPQSLPAPPQMQGAFNLPYRDIWHRLGVFRTTLTPLPKNIANILEKPCPWHRGRRVYETHDLVFIPQTFHGAFLDIYRLNLWASPTYPDIDFQSRRVHLLNVAPQIRRELETATCQTDSDSDSHPHLSIGNSKWILITKELVPGTRGQTRASQEARLKTKSLNRSKYRPTHLMEMLVYLHLRELLSRDSQSGVTMPTYHSRCINTKHLMPIVSPKVTQNHNPRFEVAAERSWKQWIFSKMYRNQADATGVPPDSQVGMVGVIQLSGLDV